MGVGPEAGLTAQTPPRFDGKVALVTGAGSGMGLATAKLLAAQGASVALNDVDERAATHAVADIREQGHRATACVADVADSGQVSEMVENISRELGPVDILVNNAGILRSTPFSDITPEEWDLVVGVNLRSAFLVSRAVAPRMIERKSGKIVNVSSMAGRATSTLGGAHYTAAKAGLLGLSRHLARELGRYQINVNAVCPGIVDTGMTRNAMDDRRTAEILESIPFGRLAQPNEVAALVAFLVSQEARYITGASVDIHGGEIIIA
jgi:NAD(P)-dependent dehydrogenase (short-subunit alcohol dehydrogenase family)